MKILMIINPCSGRMKIKTALFDIVQMFCNDGHSVTTYMTSKQGDATETASKAGKDNYDMIVCCGGDGTLNEVVSGMMQGGVECELGYIPSGTTNDFASSLGLNTDIIEAAKTIIDKKYTCITDIGKFGDGRYFVYIASFGMFTSVSYNTQQAAKNALGQMAYLFEGIANMANIKTYHISFDADGRKYEGDYIYGGISNSTSVGGIFKYPEDMVNLNDGFFEVLMIKKPTNPSDFMKIVTGITTGDFSDSRVFDFTRATKLELNMPRGITWTLDGEPAKGKMNLTIENIPSKLKIIK